MSFTHRMKVFDMLIELNRFLTAEEVKTKYNFPDGLFEKVQPFLPVKWRADDGSPRYLESIVDAFLHHVGKHLEFSKVTDDELREASAIVTGTAKGPLPDHVVWPDRVRIDGKEYGPLTNLEARLMDVLAGGDAVEIGDVIERVYGHDVDGKENALRSVVKRLARKLNEQQCPAFIDTVNGRFVLR